MDVYGLTGGIGSGKSTVAELLEEYGVPVVSADELSRVVVAPGSEGLRLVVERFGTEILAEDGSLDRRKMATLVFRDPERRRELEAILHPRIRDRFEQVLDALEKAGHEVAVYEVPLLFERNLQGEMKAVILVTAPMDVRVATPTAPTTTRRSGPSPAPESAMVTGVTPSPFRDAEDEHLPSRRPTAVPVAAPASIAPPPESSIPLLEPDEMDDDEGGFLRGPPTIVETGSPARKRPEAPEPTTLEDGIPADARITRIDGGAPPKR